MQPKVPPYRFQHLGAIEIRLKFSKRTFPFLPQREDILGKWGEKRRRVDVKLVIGQDGLESKPQIWI